MPPDGDEARDPSRRAQEPSAPAARRRNLNDASAGTTASSLGHDDERRRPLRAVCGRSPITRQVRARANANRPRHATSTTMFVTAMKARSSSTRFVSASSEGEDRERADRVGRAAGCRSRWRHRGAQGSCTRIRGRGLPWPDRPTGPGRRGGCDQRSGGLPVHGAEDGSAVGGGDLGHERETVTFVEGEVAGVGGHEAARKSVAVARGEAGRDRGGADAAARAGGAHAEVLEGPVRLLEVMAPRGEDGGERFARRGPRRRGWP